MTSMLPTPIPFWSRDCPKPSTDAWSQWKKTFKDYVELLPILTPTVTLDEKAKLKLLRANLGELGQRYFDASCIKDEADLEAALSKLDSMWGEKDNVFTSRYRFCQMRQDAGQSTDDFITDLTLAVQECCYKEINKDKFEEAMLIQRLIVGIHDDKARENLLSENKDLSWEKACQLARRRERVRHGLNQLKHSVNPSGSTEAEPMVSKINAPSDIKAQSKPSPSSRHLRECYRCGQHHIRWSDCKHQKTVCRFCKKLGHIERVCISKKRTQTDTHATYMDVPRESSRECGEESIFQTTPTSMSHLPPYTVSLPVDRHVVKFEIDTGSAVTLINEASLQPLPRLQPALSTFRSYTGQNVDVRGVFTAEVEHGGELHHLPVHVVRGSLHPNLLGRNWIKLLPAVMTNVNRLESNAALNTLLAKHQQLFQENASSHFLGKPVKFEFKHDFHPRFFKARPVPYAIAPKVEEEIDRLLKMDIIEPVQYSSWAAPIVPVQKPDGSVRLCGDYKLTINPATELNCYPLPRVEDLYASLSGGQQFTTLDLKHAYNQIVLDPDSRDATTINTHRGLFRYKRLPFGVSSAPGLFQSLIDNLVKGIPNVCVYMDDILLTGTSVTNHLETLDRVLTRLEEAGFKLKESKCTFLAESVEYLGFKVDRMGLHPLEDKVKAVKAAPSPENVSQLRSFLGLITHFSRFIRQSATILKPLYRLLEKNQPWKWSEIEEGAFVNAKSALSSSTVLVHYNPKNPIILKCDASPYGLGAVLMHRMTDGEELPVSFASRTMSQAEANYSQLDKEAAAIMFGLKRFHLFLYGRSFEIHTDHKPLLGLMGEKRGIHHMSSPRMQRWALTLSSYAYTMKHVPGSSNQIADALSRLPIVDNIKDGAHPIEPVNLLQNMENAPVTSLQIAQWTVRDPLLSQVKRALQVGWPHRSPPEFQPYSIRQNELSLQDGCILWGSRIVVPPQGRHIILRDLHNAHPGVVKTKALARSYVWWPGMDSEIEQMVKTCSICQRTQKAPAKVPLRPWSWPDSPWKRVHIDYFGPFMGQMVLVVVDAHTKWIEAIPTGNSCTSATTINKLRMVFATFGIPEMLVSDNGPAFKSEDFKEFVEKNGIRHLTTAPYHAASNGLAERAVQTVKQGLAKQTQADLPTKLARFLFSYRTTSNELTGSSPSEMMFKRQLHTRFDLLHPSRHNKVAIKQEKMKNRYDCQTKPRSVLPNDHVYTRLPHEQLWRPAVVRSSEGQIVELELKNGQTLRRHLDHVRDRREAVRGTPRDEEDFEYTDDDGVESAASTEETSQSSVNRPGVHQDLVPNNTLERQHSEQAEAAVESEGVTPELRRSTRNRNPVQRFQAGVD